MIEKSARAEISFTQEEMEEFIEGQIGYRIVVDEISETSRWSVHYWLVIERLEDATFWGATYRVGATEMQWYDWEDKWDTRDGRAVFTQVFPKRVETIVYE